MRLAPALMFTAYLATGAQAADYLRGPISSEPVRPAQSGSIDWSGFYIGGQASYLNAYVDHSSLANRLAPAIFPSLSANQFAGQLLYFGKPHVNGTGYGAFAGYNTQWDDVVLGLELDYNRGGITATSISPTIARNQPDTAYTPSSNAASRFYSNTIGGRVTTRIQDLTALKVRAGAAFGSFLPYVTGGVVVGRASTKASGSGSTQHWESQPLTDTNGNIIGYNVFSIQGLYSGAGQIKDQGWRWGYTFGAGVDFALTDNIFLRGAWDYTQIGSGGARSGVNAFKGGAGVKF